MMSWSTSANVGGMGSSDKGEAFEVVTSPDILPFEILNFSLKMTFPYLFASEMLLGSLFWQPYQSLKNE